MTSDKEINKANSNRLIAPKPTSMPTSMPTVSTPSVRKIVRPESVPTPIPEGRIYVWDDSTNKRVRIR